MSQRPDVHFCHVRSSQGAVSCTTFDYFRVNVLRSLADQVN